MTALSLAIAVVAFADTTDTAVSPADYPQYREALRPSAATEAPLVSFGDLWSDSGRWQGRRLAVVGQIERRFRQPAVGEFPALTEAWLVDNRGNPFCVVFPSREPSPSLGQSVRFEGTYLRRIRYRGGDADRLAPLLVGPASPRPEGPATPLPGSREPWVGADWAIGLGLGALVVVVLGAQHLRLKRVPRRELGPPPTFLSASEEPVIGEGP